MNVLELCLSTALGGLELYFHRCTVELASRNQAVLSVRSPRSRLLELARSEGAPVATLSRSRSVFPLIAAIRLARLIETRRIDIVHSHLSDDLPLCALAKRLCRRHFKLIFTRQMWLSHRKKDPYHRWLYSAIDRFIVITDQLKQSALDLLPLAPDRIVRLYYGVDGPPARDDRFLGEFLSISSPGDFTIGVFSRIEFQKGQHLAIEALNALRLKGIPAKLYIAGTVMDDSYQRTLLTRINELHLEAHVVFKGFVGKPTAAMLGMDVIVLPSRGETFGLTLVEAMRCGIPVVGANAGGVLEIIDDRRTGLLFDWDRPDQLAGQLEYLYANPAARNEIAAQGKRKADHEFASGLHFGKLEQLFSDLHKESA
jgi:glycosyltransferase involved in cell wall biosynthesis